MDREVKKHKRSWIPIVKVHWNSRRGPEFTWKREDEMKRNHESDNRVPKNPENVRYKTGKGYHVVPPPYTGTFLLPKPDLVFTDAPHASESVGNVFNVESSTNKSRNDMSKTLRSDAHTVEDWISDSENKTKIEYVPKQREPSFVTSTPHVKSSRESVKKVEHHKQAANLRTNNQKSRGHNTNWNNKACFICRSLNHLIKDCNYYEKQMVQKPVWNSALRVNHQNSVRITHLHSNRNVVPTTVLTRSRLVSINAARPVPTAVTQSSVKSPWPVKHVVNKVHSPVRRPINQRTSTKTSNFNKKVTTAKVNKVNAVKDFKEIDGGYVAFGGNPKDPQNIDDDVVDAAFDVKENETDVDISANGSDKTEFSFNSTKRVNAVCSLVNVAEPNPTNNTNSFNTASHFVNVVSPNFGITRKSSFVDPFKYLDDLDMIELEDIVYSDDEEDVFRNKKDERGVVIRNKASLVAQGHTQEEGIDYDKVFALVERIEAIRLFLAYASFTGFMVYQMDVKSAFLYGTIEEEVYVCQPSGFEDPDYPDKFSKRKDCSDLIHKEAKRRHFSSLASTPIETEKPLLKDPDSEDVDVHIYRSMIGSSMYLTSSRPDIMFSICACARFQVTPKVPHLHAVKRIFRYLKGKPHLGLWYPRDSPFNLAAYSDSDYTGASLDRKSTTRVNAARHFVTVVSYELMLFGLLKVAAVKLMLQDDADGVECFPNEDIFEELTRMGYEKPPPKLTFYKAFFSAQWKFLIHILVQCLSAKRTARNEFSYSMASSVICLATDRKFNFSKYIFDSMVYIPYSYTEGGCIQTEGKIAAIDADEDITLVDVETNEEVVAMDAESQGRINQEDVNAASKRVSAAKPTVFDDEDVTMTMAQTLIKLKVEKAKLLDEQIAQRLHDEEVQKAAARDRQEKADMERALELQRQGMTYDKVRPIFEREYKKVQTLFKPNKDVEEPKKKRVADETLLQESFKKLKAAEVSEDVQNMLEIVPVSKFKVEALLVKYPIIEWEIHTEGSRTYGKIVRVEGIIEAYQSFEDMLKGFDREDLLYTNCGVHHVSSTRGHGIFMLTEKDYHLSNAVMILMLSGKLQVELLPPIPLLLPPIPLLLPPIPEGVIGIKPPSFLLNARASIQCIVFDLVPTERFQRYMHAPLTWKLYTDCGVHHVSSTRGHGIFMLTKKDYHLSNAVMILMLSGKLQVEEDNEMARDLVMKIFMEANKPKSRNLRKMHKGINAAGSSITVDGSTLMLLDKVDAATEVLKILL
uniref:Reverse transcriptase Ty1/copia-type domain-containing protein n=1 Tax=Tanacetum cinerariifolium TaxID=118510 RepID=A0A6L2L060_TANCI|nr:hypothetical protein [Tanacetum cinerariifolium]